MRVIIFEEDERQLQKIRKMISDSLEKQDLIHVYSHLEQVENRLRQQKYDLFILYLSRIDESEIAEKKIRFAKYLFQTETDMLILCLTEREEMKKNLSDELLRVFFMGLHPLEEAYISAYMKSVRMRLNEKEKSYLEIKVNRKKDYIECKEIQYLESRGHNVYIHLVNREMVIYQKLSNLREKLPDYFVQCHKSFLVNLSYIENVKERKVTMMDGVEISVSRANWDAFEKAYITFDGFRGKL